MRHPSRRELIRTGVIGTVAAVAVGVAPSGADAAASRELLDDAHGDPAILERLVAIEQLVVFAYQRVLATVPLSASATAMLRTFLSHEQEHVKVFAEAMVKLGRTPPAPPSDVNAVSHELRKLHGSGSLVGLHRELDALPYLIGTETVAEGAYYSAMSRLSDPQLLVLAAQVMACEAQHWVSINQVLHPGDIKRDVPYSVVEG